MTPVTDLLNQNSFLKNLFDSMPCGVLVLDRERRVQAINNIVERTFGISLSDVIKQRGGGEALNCIHAHASSMGCGFSDECGQCMIRKTAIDALGGSRIEKNRATAQFFINGVERDIDLLISAAPLDHEGERLAIIIIEDITELNELKRRLKAETSFAGIIGSSAVMNELFSTIRDLADINVPVLIQGESGTGKELVASAIHSEGSRANKPFVPVNCAALPEGILESELFGHEKGAFTGAIKEKKGRFELADGGTLFLDEIGELPKTVQAKLLRVLQEGCFERVGSEKSKMVDVRIISATNRDLRAEVKKGNFRQDLYYRLAVVPVIIPPLKNRRDDIPILVEHFLEVFTDHGRHHGRGGVSESALDIMMDYPWPGNIRELQSAIRFALVKSGGKTIGIHHLPLEILEWRDNRPSRGPAKKLEQSSVEDALKRSGGNKAKAARLLGVGRATLYRFLVDFNNVS
ncbi:MAG: sigma 54-interacting transcriptional regulator [Deltaproteobacteria bacterium]|nr:sigma 54-interacting transcriptional regulator [Deltaproteobacteria bacterium]